VQLLNAIYITVIIKLQDDLSFSIVSTSFDCYLSNNTYVPVFYLGNKIWIRVRV